MNSKRKIYREFTEMFFEFLKKNFRTSSNYVVAKLSINGTIRIEDGTSRIREICFEMPCKTSAQCHIMIKDLEDRIKEDKYYESCANGTEDRFIPPKVQFETVTVSDGQFGLGLISIMDHEKQFYNVESGEVFNIGDPDVFEKAAIWIVQQISK